MKKNTIETMIAYLDGADDIDTAALRDELQGELDHLTAKEIYEACAADLPDDFTQNKVQYLRLHQLADKVKKDDSGKGANTYCL